jgi:tetratricopeptide (TPR) repeat protein
VSLVSLAHTLCEAGRVHEAEELCRLVLREQPGLAAAQAALGRVLFESGNLEGAEVWLELTVRQTPGCFAAHRWLAEVLLQRGAHDRAYSVLAQAAVLAPDNPRVQQLLSRLSDAQAVMLESAPPPGEPIHLTGPMRFPPPADDAVEVEMDVEELEPRRPRTEEYPPWTYDPRIAPPIQDYSAPSTSISRSTPPIAISRPTLATTSKKIWARAAVRGVAGVVLVGGALAAVFVVVMWVGSGPTRITTSPAASPLPTGSPGRAMKPAASESEARRQIEWAISHGGMGELTAASAAAASQLRAPEVVAAQAFAAALLANEYGLPVAAETRALADANLSDPRHKSELAAARVLFALARSDQAAAARAAEGVRETPWLTFARAKARALAGAAAPGDVSGVAVGAATVRQAESFIDQGDATRAAQVLGTLLTAAPTQARARLALAEARSALGTFPSADEVRDLRAACAVDGPRSLFIEAGCALSEAESLRRRGPRLEDRAGA